MNLEFRARNGCAIGLGSRGSGVTFIDETWSFLMCTPRKVDRSWCAIIVLTHVLFENIEVWVLGLLSLGLARATWIWCCQRSSRSHWILLSVIGHLMVLMRCIYLSAVNRLKSNNCVILFRFLWLLGEMPLDFACSILGGEIHGHLALMILRIHAQTWRPGMPLLDVLIVADVLFVLLTRLLLKHCLAHATVVAQIVHRVIFLRLLIRSDAILASHACISEFLMLNW